MTTNAEREIMIERYLSGAMTAPERSAFLERAANDPELGRHLRAEQLIGGAVGRDRSAMPGPSAASRGQFLSMLAAVTSEIPPAAPPSAPGGGAPAGSSALRYLPGSGRTRGIVAAVAGTALIIGGIVFGPRIAGRNETPRRDAVTAPAAQPVQEQPIAPEAPAMQSAQSTPAVTAPAPEQSATAGERPSATASRAQGSGVTAQPSKASARTAKREGARAAEASDAKASAKQSGAAPTLNGGTANGKIDRHNPTVIKTNTP